MGRFTILTFHVAVSSSSGRLASTSTVSRQQVQLTSEAIFLPSIHNSLKLFLVADFLTLNYFIHVPLTLATWSPNLSLSLHVIDWTGWPSRPAGRHTTHVTGVTNTPGHGDVLVTVYARQMWRTRIGSFYRCVKCDAMEKRTGHARDIVTDQWWHYFY